MGFHDYFQQHIMVQNYVNITTQNIYLSIYLFIYLFVYLFIYLPIHLFIYLLNLFIYVYKTIVKLN